MTRLHPLTPVAADVSPRTTRESAWRSRALFLAGLLFLTAQPLGAARFLVDDFGARADGIATNTLAIQRAIDVAAAAGGHEVVFSRGTYLSGALFLKSNVRLHLDEGVVLRAVPDDRCYPERPTRVAGIEMVWPVGARECLSANERDPQRQGRH